ncbi:MAG: efflux RND transporter periplasmic adaptor subunit [Caldimonas sp.]
MKTPFLVAIAAVVVAAAAAAGYALTRDKKGADSLLTAVPAAAGSAAPAASGAPISVTTIVVQKRDVEVMLDATGTVTALNSVDIRPQIASTITKVNIKEGQFVTAGQVLFTLDARNDEVNVTKAKAQLAKDMASLADAQRQLARSRDLMAQNFISQGAVDTNQMLVDTQQAVIASDRAAIESAQVGLSYNRITAPAAGRAGAINVYAGSLVQPSGAALVTITQLDPISVAFSLPQRNLASVLASLRGGGGSVTAVLPEASGAITGRLLFVDNAVDSGSGTVRVKAGFANKDERLWPGAFVAVRLAVQTLKDASVVPQAAVIQSPRGKIVYVVDASSKVSPRPIVVVYASGEDAAVTGVRPGERIVVEGRQNLRPGAMVVERAPTDAVPRVRRGAAAASGAASAAVQGAPAAASDALATRPRIGNGSGARAVAGTPAA